MFYAFLNTFSFFSEKLWPGSRNSDVKCETGGDAGVSCRISTANAKVAGRRGSEGPGRGLSHVVPFKSLFESAFGECEREAGKKGRVSLIRNNFTSGICLKIHVK